MLEVFATDIGNGRFRCVLPLFRADTVAIVRHVDIISDANPYDPEWNLYFKKCTSAKHSAMDPGLQEVDQWLEPYAARVARTILRGGRGSNASSLPDPIFFTLMLCHNRSRYFSNSARYRRAIAR
jgi:hypothetical protein